VMPNRQLSVDRLCDIGTLARDKEDFLVNLDRGQYVAWWLKWSPRTQEPSETDKTRGARGEVAGATLGILSPLVDPYDVPCQLL
jgi:hypothetical protein